MNNQAICFSFSACHEQNDVLQKLFLQEKILFDYFGPKFQIISSLKFTGLSRDKIIPELFQIMNKSNISHLLCSDISRLTRNHYDTHVLNNCLKKYPKIKIHTKYNNSLFY